MSSLSNTARQLPLLAALLTCGVLIAGACNPPPAPAKAAASRPSASAPAALELADVRWGRFMSKRFDISIALPDGNTWRIEDHKSNWLVATHPSTNSVLRARTWHESALASRDRCEQRARDWTRDIPNLQQARIVDRHPAPEVPARGYDTEVITGVALAPMDTGKVDGFSLAFGASMKKCIALVFTTSASGAGASGRVGDRLGIGMRILEGVSFRSDLDLDTHRQPGR